MKNFIEREKTYLVKYLPVNIEKFPHKEIIDIYIPKESEHAKLRIRKRGNSYVITKKSPVNENDPSIQIEQNIKITEEEFKAFLKISSNIIHKIRFEYPYKTYTAEIDVFLGKLKGLILADVEFRKTKELRTFKIPDFCLIEVTNEPYLAGGVLCHSTFSSINTRLKKYNYKKICLKNPLIK